MAEADSTSVGLSDSEKKLLTFALLTELADNDIEMTALTIVQTTMNIALRASALTYNESETDDDGDLNPKHIKRFKRGTASSSQEYHRGSNSQSHCQPVQQKPRSTDDILLKQYPDVQFRELFKMSRTTFEKLCELVGPHLPSRTLTTEKKVLATVWVLCNHESFGDISNRFEINKGTIHRIVTAVCQVLTNLRSDFIRWPDREQHSIMALDFDDRYNIPGVVGVIDCTDIPILEPKEHAKAYKNKKGQPCMKLQMVCNANLMLLDVVTGWPGSVHSCRVFRNSPLLEVLEEGALPPHFHLLGDSSYPLAPYLLVPFNKNKRLQIMERKFNTAHSMVMMEAKRAIGLLKGKFCRLKCLDMTKVTSISYLIFAACVLHNFIIMWSGVDEEDIDSTEGLGSHHRSEVRDHTYARVPEEGEEDMLLDMEVEEVPEESESNSDSDSVEEQVLWAHDYIETAAEKRFLIARRLLLQNL